MRSPRDGLWHAWENAFGGVRFCACMTQRLSPHCKEPKSTRGVRGPPVAPLCPQTASPRAPAGARPLRSWSLFQGPPPATWPGKRDGGRRREARRALRREGRVFPGKDPSEPPLGGRRMSHHGADRGVGEVELPGDVGGVVLLQETSRRTREGLASGRGLGRATQRTQAQRVPRWEVAQGRCRVREAPGASRESPAARPGAPPLSSGEGTSVKAAPGLPLLQGPPAAQGPSRPPHGVRATPPLPPRPPPPQRPAPGPRIWIQASKEMRDSLGSVVIKLKRQLLGEDADICHVLETRPCGVGSLLPLPGRRGRCEPREQPIGGLQTLGFQSPQQLWALPPACSSWEGGPPPPPRQGSWSVL